MLLRRERAGGAYRRVLPGVLEREKVDGPWIGRRGVV